MFFPDVVRSPADDAALRMHGARQIEQVDVLERGEGCRER
jgi:hypothetical protein